jgi:hypothetical protein
VDDSLIAVDSRAKEPAEIRARSIDVSNRPHAVAAVALYGKPFGFTREDVAFLKRRFDFSDDAWRTEDEARAVSLAARIEALLPTYDMTANQVVDFPVSALFPP